MSDSTTINKPIQFSDAQVYFIKASSGAIKIGITNNLTRRFDDIQASNPEPLTLLAVVRCATYELASSLEWAFHEKYEDAHVHSEWFAVPESQVIQDIRFAIRLSEANYKVDGLPEGFFGKGTRMATKRIGAFSLVHEFFERHPDRLNSRLDELVIQVEQETGVKVGRTSIHNVRREIAGGDK